ncbi:hypothetical protein JCM18899A_06140 [Nocardioides sp. AN3]
MSAAPTWYDLLDVGPTATTEEIRAAWRSAVADLDPTDRRFSRLADAAAVLLDPEKRQDYDNSLRKAPVGSDPHAADNTEPTSSRADANGPQRSEDRLASARRPARPARLAHPVRRRRTLPADLPAGMAASSVGDLPETEPGISDIEPASVAVEHDPEIPAPAAERRSARWAARTVPLWGLGVAAGAALVLVVLAAFAWTRPDPTAIEREAGTAQSTAERAVVPVLSYDYRTLAEGQHRAESWLTPRYRDKDYRPLFATIRKNAPGTQTVVSTKVVTSAVVRAAQDRVEVLLLVDRPMTNKRQTTPITYEDHVTVTMQRSGGGWLIDDMQT